MNQELEFLRSEIEKQTKALDDAAAELREAMVFQLNALNDRGEAMSSRLQQLDIQLREMRSREDEILHSKSH